MSLPGLAARTEVLARLKSSRRRLDRLDHWPLDPWIDSPALRLAPLGGSAWAAALAIPVDTDGPGDWLPRPGGPAWLRWCSVTDGAALGPSLRRLLAEETSFLQARGLTGLWALGDESRQFDPSFVDDGFQDVDAVITFERRRDPGSVQASSLKGAGIEVRDVTPGDWLALNRLDERTFGDPWRYGTAMLALELAAASVSLVAVEGGRPVGYATAVARDGRAHVNRLAVDRVSQGRGLGRVLLEGVLDRLWAADTQRVTLNTQASNLISQRLYRSAGFRLVGAPLRVYHQPFT